nr:hypothetical protein Itr_chr14CG31380 [Ipomoea trifida]
MIHQSHQQIQKAPKSLMESCLVFLGTFSECRSPKVRDTSPVDCAAAPSLTSPPSTTTPQPCSPGSQRGGEAASGICGTVVAVAVAGGFPKAYW